MTAHMRRGAALLVQWRENKSLSQWQAAKFLDVSPTLISRYERGIRVPGLATALKIEKKTSGAVPVEIWQTAGKIAV